MGLFQVVDVEVVVIYVREVGFFKPKDSRSSKLKREGMLKKQNKQIWSFVWGQTCKLDE